MDTSISMPVKIDSTMVFCDDGITAANRKIAWIVPLRVLQLLGKYSTFVFINYNDFKLKHFTWIHCQDVKQVLCYISKSYHGLMHEQRGHFN